MVGGALLPRESFIPKCLFGFILRAVLGLCDGGGLGEGDGRPGGAGGGGGLGTSPRGGGGTGNPLYHSDDDETIM